MDGPSAGAARQHPTADRRAPRAGSGLRRLRYAHGQRCAASSRCRRRRRQRARRNGSDVHGAALPSNGSRACPPRRRRARARNDHRDRRRRAANRVVRGTATRAEVVDGARPPARRRQHKESGRARPVCGARARTRYSGRRWYRVRSADVFVAAAERADAAQCRTVDERHRADGSLSGAVGRKLACHCSIGRRASGRRSASARGRALRAHARCPPARRLGRVRPGVRRAREGDRGRERFTMSGLAQPNDDTPGTAVIALGGNALAPAGQRSNVYDQFRHTRASLGPIVDLVSAGWNVCVVHGNGPQVGDELVRNEIARYDAPPLPLGVLVAATAGWIGYMVQQSIDNALRRAGTPRDVATIITQVVVDPNDPALRNPTKFIGRELPPERADELEREGYVVKADGHGRPRRVVGSPRPLAIHELASVRRLLDAGSVVIACGGGGAPIYDDPRLGWEGLDAVVDKDLAAAVLARDLGAELLLILTDVDAVYANWGTPDQRPLPRLTIDA